MLKHHEWNLSGDEAKALQRELAGKIVLEDQFDEIRYVAGVDMAINENNGMARAAVVLFSYPDLTILEKHVYEEPLRMDYIPGLLSFREMPSLLGALEQLKQQPDLVMTDGQGIAHPRRLGIGAHLGLWIDKPTIGCAKSILVGTHEPVGEAVGDWSPLSTNTTLSEQLCARGPRSSRCISRRDTRSAWRAASNTCWPAAEDIVSPKQRARLISSPKTMIGAKI